VNKQECARGAETWKKSVSKLNKRNVQPLEAAEQILSYDFDLCRSFVLVEDSIMNLKENTAPIKMLQGL
jgi:hypothetical protein